MGNPTRLTPGDPAAHRYLLLIAALGGDPSDPQHRATLARLCAWTTRGDIDTLCELVRGEIDRTARPLRAVVADVAKVLDRPHPMSSDEHVVVGVPIGLVCRIRGAALGGLS